MNVLRLHRLGLKNEATPGFTPVATSRSSFFLCFLDRCEISVDDIWIYKLVCDAQNAQTIFGLRDKHEYEIPTERFSAVTRHALQWFKKTIHGVRDMYLQSTLFGELQLLPSGPAHRYVIPTAPFHDTGAHLQPRDNSNLFKKLELQTLTYQNQALPLPKSHAL